MTNQFAFSAQMYPRGLFVLDVAASFGRASVIVRRPYGSLAQCHIIEKIQILFAYTK